MDSSSPSKSSRKRLSEMRARSSFLEAGGAAPTTCMLKFPRFARIEMSASPAVLTCPVMQTGIIGLPSVGKTTLFQILTKAHVDHAKGGQDTRVGVAKVPEPRLGSWPPSTIPKKSPTPPSNTLTSAACKKSAMRESLASLREVDSIAHVIRVFDDPSVPHSEGSIDPLRDATNLDLELILSDHEQIVTPPRTLGKRPEEKGRQTVLELEKAVLENAKRTSNPKSLFANCSSRRKSASPSAVFSSSRSAQCSTF